MYEKLALIEALKSTTASLSMTDEEIAFLAEEMVESLHEQAYRLVSFGISVDD